MSDILKNSIFSLEEKVIIESILKKKIYINGTLRKGLKKKICISLIKLLVTLYSAFTEKIRCLN